MIKLEKSESMKEQKHEILEILSRFKCEASFKAVRVIIDVDPL